MFEKDHLKIHTDWMYSTVYLVFYLHIWSGLLMPFGTYLPLWTCILSCCPHLIWLETRGISVALAVFHPKDPERKLVDWRLPMYIAGFAADTICSKYVSIKVVSSYVQCPEYKAGNVDLSSYLKLRCPCRSDVGCAATQWLSETVTERQQESHGQDLGTEPLSLLWLLLLLLLLLQRELLQQCST